MMEPNRNNNTTTSAKKSQTLILAEDRDDGTLVHFTLTAGEKVILGNGYEGVNKHAVELSPTCKQEKPNSKTLRGRSFTIIHVKFNLSPVTDHDRRTTKGSYRRAVKPIARRAVNLDQIKEITVEAGKRT